MSIFTTSSFGSSCFSVYSTLPSREVQLGKSATKINQLLNLNETDLSKSGEKLSTEDQQALKSIAKRTETIKLELEKLNVPQEKAEEWLKKLIKEKFLFGVLHEGVWLYSVVKSLNSEKPTESHRPLLSRFHLKNSDELDLSHKIYAGLSRNDAQTRQLVFRTQIEFYFIDLKLPFWKDLNSVDRKIVLNKYEEVIRNYNLPEDDFYSQMNTLSDIFHQDQKGGVNFLKYIIENSGQDLDAQSKIRHSSLLGSTVGSAVVLSGIGMFTGSIDGGIGGFTALSTIIAGVFGPLTMGLLGNGPYKGRFKALPARIKARNRMMELIKSESLNRKSQVVQESIVTLEKAEDTDDFSFAQIKAELERGLNENILLVPSWGDSFSKGLLSLNKRVKNLKRRFELVANDNFKIIQRLDLSQSKDLSDLSEKELEAYSIINSISKEDLINLFIDYQSIKLDFMALAISLDKYSEKLEKLTSSENFNVHYSNIVSDQHQLFSHYETMLENLTMHVITGSQMVEKTLHTLNIVSSSIHLDMLKNQLKD